MSQVIYQESNQPAQLYLTNKSNLSFLAALQAKDATTDTQETHKRRIKDIPCFIEET